MSLYNKISDLLKRDSVLYIISNFIFSFSTYLIMLLVPYYLTIDKLGDFTATYQIILFYILIFELGLSISYVRYNKLYKSTRIINSFLQIFILIIVILLPYSFIGDYLNEKVNINQTGIYSPILYFSSLSLLSWTFLKSILLSFQKYYLIFFFAVIILVIRLICITIFSINEQYISINYLFFFFFIIPFIPTIFYLLKYHIKNIKDFIIFQINNKINFLSLFQHRIKKYLSFSSLTFISSLIYGFTLNILIIKLLELNEKIKLSELGYSMTFIGIVSIFVISIRNFYISKFKFNDKIQIRFFLDFISSLKIKAFFLSLFISLLVSIIVYFIKPNYLSNNTIVYTAILIFSYMLISYFSMYTLLAKIFNENFLEIKINLIRCISVYLIVYFCLEKSFDLTLILIYSIIPIMEFIYYKILISKIKKKGAL